MNSIMLLRMMTYDHGMIRCDKHNIEYVNRWVGNCPVGQCSVCVYENALKVAELYLTGNRFMGQSYYTARYHYERAGDALMASYCTHLIACEDEYGWF